MRRMQDCQRYSLRGNSPQNVLTPRGRGRSTGKRCMIVIRCADARIEATCCSTLSGTVLQETNPGLCSAPRLGPGVPDENLERHKRGHGRTCHNDTHKKQEKHTLLRLCSAVTKQQIRWPVLCLIAHTSAAAAPPHHHSTSQLSLSNRGDSKLESNSAADNATHQNATTWAAHSMPCAAQGHRRCVLYYQPGPPHDSQCDHMHSLSLRSLQRLFA
jgi:hypothetical protein